MATDARRVKRRPLSLSRHLRIEADAPPPPSLCAPREYPSRKNGPCQRCPGHCPRRRMDATRAGLCLTHRARAESPQRPQYQSNTQRGPCSDMQLASPADARAGWIGAQQSVACESTSAQIALSNRRSPPRPPRRPTSPGAPKVFAAHASICAPAYTSVCAPYASSSSTQSPLPGPDHCLDWPLAFREVRARRPTSPRGS